MRQINQIMEKIFQVRNNQLTVDQAVQELGISRKTYYELENKALEAMYQSLIPGKPGRPAQAIDEEKEELKQQLSETQKKLMLAEQAMEIQHHLFGDANSLLTDSKKNSMKNSAKRARKKRRKS